MVEVRDTVAVVVDELDHMGALVERLLMLGRALEPDFLDTQPLDLRAFLSELFEAARVLADRRLDAGPGARSGPRRGRGQAAWCAAEPDRQRRPGHRHRRCHRDQAPAESGRRQLVVAVDDSGPGIPEERAASVVERFGRLGVPTATGTGLGLAIVTAVAEAHGGHFELGASRLGGCRAAVVLPAPAWSRTTSMEAVGV